jgi:hypothetical protein
MDFRLFSLMPRDEEWSELRSMRSFAEAVAPAMKAVVHDA